MAVLTLNQFTNTPTIGAILGTQGSNELINELNKEFGSQSSFFGSNDDPFNSQHMHFIKQVVEPIRIVANQFKQQFKEMFNNNENIFRPITSLSDLEGGIPECMWVPIAMHPIIRKFGEQNRVDLFGIDAKNLPEENVYQRLIDNGEVTITADELKSNGGKYTVEFTYNTTDPKLSDDDLDAIRDTYSFIELFYSDLEDVYRKCDMTHVLKDKSYLQDDTQIMDLDFTAFPYKKG